SPCESCGWGAALDVSAGETKGATEPRLSGAIKRVNPRQSARSSLVSRRVLELRTAIRNEASALPFSPLQTRPCLLRSSSLLGRRPCSQRFRPELQVLAGAAALPSRPRPYPDRWEAAARSAPAGGSGRQSGRHHRPNPNRD